MTIFNRQSNFTNSITDVKRFTSMPVFYEMIWYGYFFNYIVYQSNILLKIHRLFREPALTCLLTMMGLKHLPFYFSTFQNDPIQTPFNCQLLVKKIWPPANVVGTLYNQRSTGK